VSYATSRRSFLRAVGGFAATMPFIRLLERSALGDPPAGPPLRFMALRHNHGTPTEFWRPQPGFVINGPNQSLQPYDDAATFGKSWKNNLVVIDGVNNVVAGECNSGGHASTPTIWTGSTLSPTPKCESIETYLAVTKGLGNATQFPTILYGPGGAYGAGGVQLDMMVNSLEVFQTLFANFMPPAMQNMAAQADTLARGKSTLDFITSSLTSLQGRLATPEKALLDQHLMAIRQIENRLTAPAAACSSVPTTAPSSNVQNGDYDNQTILMLLAQAFACDLTRFVQYCLDDPGSPIGASTQDPGVVPAIPLCNPPAGATCSDNTAFSADCDHMDVAHTYVTSYPFQLGGGGTAAQITSQIRLARLNKYFATQLATFAQSLDAAGLLDSTLILTMSDVGNPALHNSSGLPTILLGGANGYFKMGQVITPANGTTQNAIYVSIANAFGIPITSYGVSANASTTAGPLPGLAA
jgi:hypothetical protein